MIYKNNDSETLKKLWQVKEEAYKEVKNSKSIKEMISKRIKKCKEDAATVKIRH